MGELASEKHVQYIVSVEKVHYFAYLYSLSSIWMFLMFYLSKRFEFCIFRLEERFIWISGYGTSKNERCILGIDHPWSIGKAWCCQCRWCCVMDLQVPARVRCNTNPPTPLFSFPHVFFLPIFWLPKTISFSVWIL